MSGYIFKLARKIAGEEPLFPEKGGKGGGDNGAGAQAEAMKYSADLQNDQFNRIMANLAPFTDYAQKYVGQMANLSTLEGQNQALQGYYGSDQYKGMADQARYQALNAAEATGGLGSTATMNQLAAIAPTLGQSWLGDQMNSAQNLANIGLGALQGQANAGQNYANNMGQLLQQNAAAQAAAANRPSQFQTGIKGALGGAAAGGAIGGPWGAAIGGGLGLLGGIF
ncbi:DNA transfer protein [Morganella morganii]|uniref:DNA transfer protein n=1 Tax=Morganella morganii TaxID=582 RepID=UPI003EBAF214